ncbi:auxin response factor 11-like [Cynara cardunculus var. scolymus]|uniref:auxin response factor 11-like n=1 Tax=Cynara cardunculus var. scolymus TaxID=59895 RepID=UPI000D62E54D|nr:auxin response factor 11-like [Cynara cardunculus var. scolymus]
MASSSSHNGIKNELYKELWMACAGPLVDIPVQGERVFYFPQGHIEQLELEDSMSDELMNQQISKLDLPYKMLCRVINFDLKVEPETDEVYAIIRLHPFQEVVHDTARYGHPPLEEPKLSFRSFCKILTTSDTGSAFSVPKKLAENCLPPLDMSQPQPKQELILKDLHGRTWHFTHVYRGNPRRQVITAGWTTFVASKRLVAGDALIFVRAWPFVVRLHKYVVANAINFAGSNIMMKLASEEDSHIEIRHTGVALEETDISEEWPGSTWRSIKVRWKKVVDQRSTIRLPERVSRWLLELAEDGRSNVRELEAGSSWSRHKRLRIYEHGPMSHGGNANWGESVHAIPWSSTGLVDEGKECENPQVLRLFGVDIQLVPYSSGHVMVQAQGNDLVQTVDLSLLEGYEELKKELEKIFKIKGELHGHQKWEVVYEDGDGDLLVLADKPWK